MKIIYTVYRYFPEKCGGIQTHISEISSFIKASGFEVKIAAGADKTEPKTYQHENIDVYRYPVYSSPPEEPNHGAYSHGGFEQFKDWLKAQDADIYHQHQWMHKCGLQHIKFAKEIGLKTFITFHLPQPICYRRTLLRDGIEACNGEMEVVRCSRCCSHTLKKVPAPLISALSGLPTLPISHIPLPQSTYFPSMETWSKGSLTRPFVLPTYIASRKTAILELLPFVDYVISPCRWLYDMLILNRVPEEKLLLCRNGIPDNFLHESYVSSKGVAHNAPLKLGVIGRWVHEKGFHIIAEAVKQLPKNVNIDVFFHGVPSDIQYFKQVSKLAEGEPRIHIGAQLSREEIPRTISSWDALLVPSQWLEVGPLTALEAHALKVPVIGSNLGGVPECVCDGENGLLVTQFNDVTAWVDVLTRIVNEPTLLPRLKAGIKPVRTISQQGRELLDLYRQELYGPVSSRSNSMNLCAVKSS